MANKIHRRVHTGVDLLFIRAETCVAGRPYSPRDPCSGRKAMSVHAAFSGERESERCDRRQWRMKGAERINRNKQWDWPSGRALCAD